jgi:hypothetical protein
VASQLSTYNASFTVRDFRLLRVFARNADGSIVGGSLADTYWQYLEVHKLWVSEATMKRCALLLKRVDEHLTALHHPSPSPSD